MVLSMTNMEINAGGLPMIAPNREQSLPALQVYGYAMIKLSDYKKYREEFDLDKRLILIAPDSLWSDLERKLSELNKR